VSLIVSPSAVVSAPASVTVSGVVIVAGGRTGVVSAGLAGLSGGAAGVVMAMSVFRIRVSVVISPSSVSVARVASVSRVTSVARVVVIITGRT